MADAAVYQGIRKESAAFRLMKQMGWEEGAGLGKDKQGMKQHLRVKQKVDSLGVGADQAAHNWTYNTRDFDNLLKNLKVQGSKAKLESEEAEDDDDDDEEEEEEEESEAEKEVKVRKICRPQGRYKRMERAKMVKNYSKTDLACILGGAVIVGADSRSTGEDVDKNAPIAGAEEASEEETKAVPRAALAKNESSDSDEEEEEEEPCVPVDWWGSKLGFVRAGFLGASHVMSDSGRKSFSESDQEQLYHSAQNKASSGRGGLGIGDRPKKIGGARWKGQKISFEDIEVSQSAVGTETGRKRKSERKDTAEQPRFKWRRLCKDYLLQTPEKRMSLKKLQRQVSAAAGTDRFSDLEMFKKKLSKSSRFRIMGNKISIACEA